MDKVFFKIIIANYNNAKYIKQCLDSILQQTFQDFKVIVVDDMSTDRSDQICKDYSIRYPDKVIYKRIEHKSYAGICRNIALDYPLECKYIWAIDGDDYVYSKNAFEILYKHAKDEKNDAVFFDGYQLKNGKLVNIVEHVCIDLNNPSKCDPTCHWLKIAKPICFSKYLENVMIGQDLYHSYLTLDSIKTYKCISDRLYVYRYNSDSVSHKRMDIDGIKHREQHRVKLKQSLEELISLIHNKNIIANIKSRIKMVDTRIMLEQRKLNGKT